MATERETADGAEVHPCPPHAQARACRRPRAAQDEVSERLAPNDAYAERFVPEQLSALVAGCLPRCGGQGGEGNYFVDDKAAAEDRVALLELLGTLCRMQRPLPPLALRGLHALAGQLAVHLPAPTVFRAYAPFLPSLVQLLAVHAPMAQRGPQALLPPPVPLPTPGGEEKASAVSLTDPDDRGVFEHLATAGGQLPWGNPARVSVLHCTAPVRFARSRSSCAGGPHRPGRHPGPVRHLGAADRAARAAGPRPLGDHHSPRGQRRHRVAAGGPA